MSPKTRPVVCRPCLARTTSADRPSTGLSVLRGGPFAFAFWVATSPSATNHIPHPHANPKPANQSLQIQEPCKSNVGISQRIPGRCLGNINFVGIRLHRTLQGVKSVNGFPCLSRLMAMGLAIVSLASLASITRVEASVNLPKLPLSGSTNSLPKEKVIEFSSDGRTQLWKGNLYTSKNQPFAMYILSGYKASPEEPGKDTVSLGKVPNFSMRIEVLPKNSQPQQLKKTAVDFLRATGNHVEEDVSKTYRQDPFFRNALVFHAANSKGTTSIFIVQVQGQPVRFTVFCPGMTDSIAPFLAMMKTISLNPAK